jgi:hypothetical protein
VDAASGLVTAWNPGTTSATGSPPEVYSLVASGGHLYVGGYFVTAGGQSRSCAASFALSTGLLDSWNPNIGGVGIVSPSVFAMAAYSNTLFAVGVIGNAGASNRLNIVQLDGTTGLATSWDAKEVLVTSSGILMNNISSVAVYSNTVYVGGFLINIGGQPRGFAAALDVNTGLATAWNPQPNFIPRACCGSGSALYLGGLFGALSCMQRTNLAAYDLGTHQITPFSATFSGLTNASPSVNALLVVSNQLVVGGYFTNVNGVTVSNLMAFDLATGSVKTWKPSPNGIVDSLTTWSNRLFAGGLFANINGIVRTNFAEFLLDNGSMTSWDPGFSHGQILTFAVDGNTLYAGGIITSVGGVARSRLAAFDLPTDTLTSFDPGISGPQVRSVTVQNGRVYVGGRFNSVAGLPYTNYFSINADMSNLFPPHNVDGTVYGVAVVSNSAASSTVFLGGFFGNVDGQSRTNLAALDTFSDALTPWNPTMDSGYIVENLCAIDGTLYVCGQFFHAGGETMRGIAAFPLGLVGTPAIVSNSTRQLGDGSLQFRLNALGVPQATVLASSNLTGWTPLQIVPLVDGNGIFADSSATNYPRRFYRLSVP